MALSEIISCNSLFKMLNHKLEYFVAVSYIMEICKNMKDFVQDMRK